MLTSKQERFAQNIISGMNQSDAYRNAYDASNMQPETIWQRASEVAEHSHVSVRIAELKEAVASQVVWDQARFVREAEVNQTGARADKQWASANGALKLIGDATGILEAKQPNAGVVINKVTIILHPDGLPQGYQLPEQVTSPSVPLGRTSIVDEDGNIVDKATT